MIGDLISAVVDEVIYRNYGWRGLVVFWLSILLALAVLVAAAFYLLR